MEIYLPYTVKPVMLPFTPVRLDPNEDTAYLAFWADVWAKRETAIVVEHDVYASPEALEDLERCPHGWCTQPYDYLQMKGYRGLGCVKFSGRLMEVVPELWWVVSQMWDDKHKPGHWCRLDEFSKIVLRKRGIQRCDHNIKVDHTPKDRSSHGCV